MDAIPATRSFLNFIGVETSTPVSRFSVCYKYFVRCFVALVMLGIIGLHIYNMLYLETLYVMTTAKIAMFGIMLLTYVRVVIKSRKVCKLLRRIFHWMQKDELRQIRSYDRNQTLLTLVSIVVLYACMTAYYCVNGVGSETRSLALGVKRGSVKSGYALLAMFGIHLIIFLFSLLTQWYITIMYVMEKMASHMNADFLRWRRSSPPDYELILRSLKWYNYSMRKMNEDIGCLPFAVFSMKFVMFCFGITFIITNRHGQQISWTFALLTVGYANLLFFRISYAIVKRATRVWKVMSRCWDMAGESVSDPTQAMTTDGESKGKKEALMFYLTTERLVEAKACNTLIIDRSLVLSFASQLIPSTVMMITTVLQFDQKNSP